LHPKWQKEFPKLLTESFPLVQFFVSTHSPLVFLGMPKNSVFYNISRNINNLSIVQKLEIDIENIMPHQILTSSLFGMENIRNVYNKGIEYLSVETEIEKRERIANERELKRISEGFKFQLPKS
jgi:predicted ATP-binding protein involved in virulence